MPNAGHPVSPQGHQIPRGGLGVPLGTRSSVPSLHPLHGCFWRVYTPRASEGRGQAQGCPVAVAEAGGSPCTPQLGPFG